MKLICRILWAGNLLMSDLTFDPSFKVKQWFTGFGELSFQWIQIFQKKYIPLHISLYTGQIQLAVDNKSPNRTILYESQV